MEVKHDFIHRTFTSTDMCTGGAQMPLKDFNSKGLLSLIRKVSMHASAGDSLDCPMFGQGLGARVP